MIDKIEIAAAAAGRWRGVLLSLCPGLTDAALSGRHGACPRCGGSDRWRVFGNFDDTGGAICNGCQPEGLCDGFAFL